MSRTLHITSGDHAGSRLMKSGIPGEVFVWHDILYDGPRSPGWPDENTLKARARFLEEATAGGLSRAHVLETLHDQYRRLAQAGAYDHRVLWFDACLFDQSMLAHLLTCFRHHGIREIELLCVDAFPGIVPFHGLGQLQPDQWPSLYHRRRPVTDAQFEFAVRVDEALATQDDDRLCALANTPDAPLPWIPTAVARWLQERPDPVTGLGRLERSILEAMDAGCSTPGTIFAFVAAAESPPQFWGDTTLWAKINALADRTPPRVRIEGPMARLPQWPGPVAMEDFRITRAGPTSGSGGGQQG